MFAQRYYSRMTLDVSHDFTSSTCLSLSLSLSCCLCTFNNLPCNRSRFCCSEDAEARSPGVRAIELDSSEIKEIARHTKLSSPFRTWQASLLFRLSEPRQPPRVVQCLSPSSLSPSLRARSSLKTDPAIVLAFSDPTSKLAISLLYCLLFAPCILKRCHAGETVKSWEGRGTRTWAVAWDEVEEIEGRGRAEKRTRRLIVIKVKRKRERNQVWRVGWVEIEWQKGVGRPKEKAGELRARNFCNWV